MTDRAARVAAAVERLSEVFEERRGYPLGTNVLVPATDAENVALLFAEFGPRIPSPIVRFFERYAALSLPDLWNGIFVGPPSWIVRTHNEPRSVEHPSGDQEVIVVGSDGGGRLFVSLLGEASPIHHLPTSAVRDGRFEMPPRIGDNVTFEDSAVASDFDQFLEQVVSALEDLAAGNDRDPFAEGRT